MALSPDGVRIASGGQDNTVHVWDTTAGQLLLTYRDHTAWVFAVAWSPDGKYLASAGDDNVVRVWDAATGAAVSISRPRGNDWL